MDILSAPPFSLPKTFEALDEAIDCNAELAEAFLEIGLQSFVDVHSWKGQATPNDMEKARSTIRQFYRDWSKEGLPERYASHSPILSALAKYLPLISPSQRHLQRVLVPGAGLGRLLLEICAAGYSAEGNEISYHQLLASNYILNYTQTARQHKIYPWALGFGNHVSRSNQLQSVSVPDVHPAAELEARSAEVQSEVHFSHRMSVTAGDFCELYRQANYEGVFDAVATCFFIDTAPNIINYIKTIKHCLKAGGIWVNLGPLLWHFESSPTPAETAKRQQENMVEQQRNTVNSGPHPDGRNSAKTPHEDIGEPGSFELSNDEVIALVERFDFEILEQAQAPAGATGYIQDPGSMLQNVYRPAFWVARKRESDFATV